MTDNLTLVNHDAIQRLLNLWLFRTGIALHVYIRNDSDQLLNEMFACL